MKHISQVLIVTAKDYAPSQGFNEVAEAFERALNVRPEYDGGSNLVFNAHMPGVGLPNKHDVIYNSEQISPKCDWPSEDYLALLRKHEVWDYSSRNVSRLLNLGVDATHVPIRYMPCMRKFENQCDRTIDVLFYGARNLRRMNVIRALRNEGVNAQVVSGLYGSARDEHIARAKIVVNVHYTDNGILEIFRLSHLFANRKCVVSERGGDEGLDQQVDGAVIFGGYDEMVEKCIELLGDDAAREAQEEKAFEVFSATTLSDELRRGGLV